MSRARAFLIALALGACGPAKGPSSPHAGALPRCYDLPGAARFSLRVGPDGAAYWVERVISYDYDGNSRATDRLVRLDRATGRTTTLADGVDAPLRLLKDGRILYRITGDGASAVIWQPRGGTHTVTPPDLDVMHFEVTPDEKRLVISANRRGAGGIYVVSIDPAQATGAPRWLSDATEIYAATDDVAIVAKDGVVSKVPLAGGPAVTVARFDKTTPYDDIAGYIIHYDESHFYARPLAGGADLTVVGPPGDWQMTGAPDHVFLSKKEGDKGIGLRVEGKTARPLPAVLGGLELNGAEPVDGGVIALVAQDTDHDGSTGDARDEVDVCELPPSGDAAVPVRHLPRRVAAGEDKLAAIAKAAGAKWEVIEDPPGPLTANLSFDARGGDDLGAMRRKVRELAGPIVAALGDPELRVELLYSDGRRASSFTDDLQHRRISVAGIGEAVVEEPSEYDLEIVRSTVNRDDNAQTIQCAGQVKNRTDHALTGVVADCVWGHSDAPVAISPDPLPPGAVGIFAGTQPDVPDAELWVSYRVGNGNLLIIDAAEQAKQAALFSAAAVAFDRSQLTLWTWHNDDGQITAELDPPHGFSDFSSTAQEVAATAAFDALAAPLRAALGAGEAAPVTLRIRLADGNIMEYDGEALHAPRAP